MALGFGSGLEGDGRGRDAWPSAPAGCVVVLDCVGDGGAASGMPVIPRSSSVLGDGTVVVGVFCLTRGLHVEIGIGTVVSARDGAGRPLGPFDALEALGVHPMVPVPGLPYGLPAVPMPPTQLSGDQADDEVTVEYVASDGEATVRRVRVLGVEERADGRVLVSVFCMLRNAPRDFRLDRIVSVADADGVVHEGAAATGLVFALAGRSRPRPPAKAKRGRPPRERAAALRAPIRQPMSRAEFSSLADGFSAAF